MEPGGKNTMRWGLKNTSEKLEELRQKLEEAEARIKVLERRLDETDERVKGVVGERVNVVLKTS
jgi:chromosome segregation ATPase